MTETGSRFPAGPAGGTGRLTALDGIRALAALAVLVYHVAVETGAALHDGFLGALLSRGDVAVPVFFTLSGFLLYLPHARAVIEGTAAPRAGAYLLRRALRILPAYWLVVAVALPLWSPEHVTDAATWLKLLLLVHVYDPAPWWSGLGPAGLAQMWSLCVETAFYLVLPLLAAALAWFAARKGADPGRRARRLLTALAAISALSYLWTLLVYYPEYRPHLVTWLPRSATFFTPGMALAVVAVWARREPDGPAARAVHAVRASAGTLWLVAGLAYAVAASPVTGPRFLGIDGVWSGLFELALYSLVAACLVAPAALLPHAATPMGRLLATPVLRYLGRVSYGVFLWQFVVLRAWYSLSGQQPFTGNLVPNLFAVGALTVLLAAVTHHLVEEPFRRLAHRLTSRRDASVTTSPEPSVPAGAS